jgi:phosphatidylglycerol---prolipoprotein diacylglyceryl transferase
MLITKLNNNDTTKIVYSSKFITLKQIKIMLNYITWAVDPTMIEIRPVVVFRWYGVLFALGIVFGYQLVKRVFILEGLGEQKAEYLLYFTVAGTIVGARLGHVFFYDWAYYSQNLAEIPQIWQGGLASHGGGVGIILFVWICSRFILKKSLLFTLDRLTLAVSTGSIFIRLGNLMNHEIIGTPTDLPWAFIFKLEDNIPRHPAQLYESLAFMMILATMLYMYYKTSAKHFHGFMFGVFLVMTFIARILVEFVKESQGGFEESFGMMSTGQWLSIPFIMAGLIIIFTAKYRKESI